MGITRNGFSGLITEVDDDGTVGRCLAVEVNRVTRKMIAIPIPIQTPHAPDGPVFDFLFFHVYLFFFPLATSRGNPGGFWNDPGRDFRRTAPNSGDLAVANVRNEPSHKPHGSVDVDQ